MKVALVTFLLVTALSSAACGGGGGGDGDTSAAGDGGTTDAGEGDKAFTGEGYSFTYPGEWDEREVGQVTPGAIFTTAFAPEEGLSGLLFEVSNIGRPITETNIDAATEELAGAIQESTEGPIQLSVAGLPTLRIVSHPQSGLTRRITTVFDEEIAYVFDCGFTPALAAEVQRGCDQVEASFQVE